MRRLTILVSLLLLALLVSLSAPAQDVITTFIGGGPNGIPATDAFLYQPYGVATDGAGNVYFAAWNQNRVFKVNTSGVISVVAGSGASNYSGDGVTGGAGNADLEHPFGVAVDSSGNVYIADEYNCVVRKVTSAKTITTIAGTAGQCNSTGSDLSYPTGLVADTSGNLFITDTNNCVVRKLVLSSGAMSVVAGTLGGCGYSGDGGTATSAKLANPQAIAIDSSGDLFISDTNNYVVREVKKSTGNISTIAGNHTYGYTGDGNPATSAELTQVQGITVNSAGTTVTVADYNNQRIRQFTVGGNITTVAGNGTACSGTCGEGGTATSAELYYPVGLAVHSGTYYIGNNDNEVLDSFTVAGNLSLFAGNHSATTETIINGAPANGVQLNYPFAVANDSSNDVYIGDSHNFRIREYVKSTGLVNYFAGNGTYGYSGNGSVATDVEITYAYGVANDSSNNVYVADYNNCLIREVNTSGAISNFAGYVNGTSAGYCGSAGDGESATNARLNGPIGVTVDSKKNVYIADFSNNAVRKVSSGTITTIAGIDGVQGFSGDGGLATNALLNRPSAMAVDKAGNVFIADTYNCRVREVLASTGIIITVAGNGSCSFSGDGLATSNAVGYPQGVAVDANDNLFIGDYNNRVRWVAPNGIMTTVAGTGAGGFDGDGGLAIYAIMNEPTGVALDTSGNIVVSDYNNARIRKISVFPAVSTSTGSLSFGLTPVKSTSSPQTFTVSAYGPVTISNIATSGAFSEADDCPASLTNGSTCMMYVYFAPTGSGTAQGNVTINNNGYFSQVNTVTLTGQGSAISLSGSPLSFGNQLVKTTSAAKTVTVKNNGTTAVTMGAITSTNTTDYTETNTCPASGSTLAGGASCTVTVKFNPQATGAKRGTIVVNDSDPSTPQLIGLSGTGTSNVSLSPTTVTFNTTAVTATSAASKITLTNNTGASITLANPAVSVTGPFVVATTTTCTPDLVIASTGTCVINVEFKPTVVGFASGSVSVFDNDVTGAQSVALQGYGTAVKFTPGSVTFGATNRGTQVYASVTITNEGKTPVAFTGGEISGANSADFSVSSNVNPPCNNGSSTPLQPGKTCQITVYFDPSIVGSESATFKVFDNSVGSPQTMSLKGTGQ
ncbi:MAG TPA: choice-of-anchor D domain-containing protein [Verrucomicrobiae bacterium]|nr:choice-of-anchor D domain-containing protein [Verrucomicrobiae bacterium]